MEEMQCNIAVNLKLVKQEVRSPAPVRSISNSYTSRRPFARILESVLPKRKYRIVQVNFSSFTNMWWKTSGYMHYCLSSEEPSQLSTNTLFIKMFHLQAFTVCINHRV